MGTLHDVNEALDPVATDDACCPFVHPPRRCEAHVEECTSCHWRGGGNWTGAPCVKCGGVVVKRPCRAWPAIGGTVCPKHGGQAPQVRKAGKRRLAIAKADAKLRDLEYEPVTAPIADLADLAGQEKALMAWAAARVAELSNEIVYTNEDDVEQLRVVVTHLERCRERTARRLVDLAKLGLEERRQAVEEAKLELVAAALRIAAERSGLTPAQTGQVIEAFGTAVVELEKANSSAPK